jgi:crotonobetainyl-CoA:carnitine CoA-transferase CaiB-like acyl-CoA transferase
LKGQDFSRQSTQVCGCHPYPSFPARFDGKYPAIRRVGPLLGEDNEYVLKQLLDMRDDEIAHLQQQHVIGHVPIG